ncbi:hypothetical protein L5515_004677 [Caenorhabditis briggsae]|uniref:Uncharacterized protein n=1 Tax=Caenorhabditis briggsae TaxID=6238 RepID=A0AAE9ELG2_CAEBR|nr:hypothetical protein L5515_004677 [Caenorhabditis briggsae]
MEQSPNFKSNLNSEMSDLIHQAEEWAQMWHSLLSPPPQDPKLEVLLKQTLHKASLILLEKTGVKTIEEFQQFFDSIRNVEKEENVEVQREATASSPLSFDEFQGNSKWTELLEESLASFSPINCRRRTSLFSDLQILSPIVSETSQSPEKTKKQQMSTPHITPFRRPLFSSMSTPKTQWRRGNSMYVEDVANTTITPQKALSTSRLSIQSPVPLAGETPLENRASRLRRMKIEEKMREIQMGWN